MTAPRGCSAAAGIALARARGAQSEVASALERIAALAPDAWMGRAAELWQARMRRLAAEAAMVLDRCVQVCGAPSRPRPRPLG